MAEWPSTLPGYFLRGSYQEELPDSTLSTDMDTGPPKERVRFEAVIAPFSGVMRMTAAEVATLRGFYKDTARQKTVPFTMAHPITREVITVKFAAAPTLSDGPPGKFNVQLRFNIQP